LDRLATQTATAPTFADLLGVAPLPGWWGRSLFAATYEAPLFVATEGQAIAVKPEIDHRLADSDLVAAALKLFRIVQPKADAIGKLERGREN
jgi:hypothetical protein